MKSKVWIGGISVVSPPTVDAFASWKTSHLLGKVSSLQLNASNLTGEVSFQRNGSHIGELSEIKTIATQNYPQAHKPCSFYS